MSAEKKLSNVFFVLVALVLLLVGCGGGDGEGAQADTDSTDSGETDAGDTDTETADSGKADTEKTDTETTDTEALSKPLNLTASAISSSQIDISWTESAGSIGVTGYQVQRCSGADCTSFAQMETTEETAFVDTELAAMTTYVYRVRATDGAGKVSAFSSTASATTLPNDALTNPTADAGAILIGSAAYPVPEDAIFVSPDGNDLSGNGTELSPYKTVQHGVGALDEGGTLVLRAGVYHEGGVGQSGVGGIEIFDNNATIQNYPGEAVWLDGSSETANWNKEGTTWTTPFTTSFDRSPTWTKGADDSTAAYYGFINPKYPCAAWPEQVFVDGVQLQQVDALNLVTTTTFYVAGSITGGTEADKYVFNPTKIHIGINPSGHVIHVSDLQTAMTIWSGTTGVTIKGIGVRRYATSMPMMAALKVSGSNAVLENVHIEDIATSGANSTNANNTFRKVTALRCGNRGFAAYKSDDLELDRVRAQYCNSEHFNYAPECGGMKVGASRRVSIHNSIFSNNYAKGLWFDVSVDRPTVYSCDFIDNEHYGIFYEISANGICANNLIKGSPNAGLVINNTDNMRVWNNSVIDCGGNTQSSSARPLSVYQDERRPFPAGAIFGRDTRQDDAYYTSTMTWVITKIEIYNNLVAEPRTGTQGVFCIDDTERNSGKARLLQSYNVQMDGNVFHWATQPAYPYVFPPATEGGVNPATYQSHALMVGATGLDTNGSEIVLTSPVDASNRVTASNKELHAKATGLPADIAALVGQPAGTKQAGCWR